MLHRYHTCRTTGAPRGRHATRQVHPQTQTHRRTAASAHNGHRPTLRHMRMSPAKVRSQAPVPRETRRHGTKAVNGSARSHGKPRDDCQRIPHQSTPVNIEVPTRQNPQHMPFGIQNRKNSQRRFHMKHDRTLRNHAHENTHLPQQIPGGVNNLRNSRKNRYSRPCHVVQSAHEPTSSALREPASALHTRKASRHAHPHRPRGTSSMREWRRQSRRRPAHP